MTVSRRRMKHGPVKMTRLVRVTATVQSHFDGVRLALISGILD